MVYKGQYCPAFSPVCAVCKQSFAKSLKLKEHMRLHKNLNADGSVHDILPYRWVV